MSHPVALALPSAAQHTKAAENLTRRPPGFAAREGADDAELMAWAGVGDRAAFDLLVARHGECTLRLALRVLGDPAEAEDVAQEAFLRAWRAAARFDPDRARFSTRLHWIALNLAIDRARRRAAAPPALDLAEDLPDLAAVRDAGLGAAERAALEAALAEPPPRQRAAVAPAYVAGPSGAEAARPRPAGRGARRFARRKSRARRAVADQAGPGRAVHGGGGGRDFNRMVGRIERARCPRRTGRPFMPCSTPNGSVTRGHSPRSAPRGRRWMRRWPVSPSIPRRCTR
jgi:RNA polymerase sigma-70 factor, ECF subfamily